MKQASLFDFEHEQKEESFFDNLMADLETLSRNAERDNKMLEKMLLKLNPDCKSYQEVHEKLNPPKDKKPIIETEIILSMEALEVLKQCIVDGNMVKLPAQQLDRKDYEAVKKKLELIGGKWKGGKVQGFEFKEDPRELLNQISNGEDRNLKKEYQFFATPKPVAAQMVYYAEIKKGERILEPSAGQGAIVKTIYERNDFVRQIDCCELMPLNQTFLNKIDGALIIADDFMALPEAFTEYYDKIVANPPFTKNQDIDHIRKMFDCLKVGGRLVTLASTSWVNGSQKKQIEFKEWLDAMDALIEDVPAGAFKESGTNVAAVLIVIDKAA